MKQRYISASLIILPELYQAFLDHVCDVPQLIYVFVIDVDMILVVGSW